MDKKRGKGRPSKEHPLDVAISVHVTKEIYDDIFNACCDMNLTISEFIRKALIEYIDKLEMADKS